MAGGWMGMGRTAEMEGGSWLVLKKEVDTWVTTSMLSAGSPWKKGSKINVRDKDRVHKKIL